MPRRTPLDLERAVARISVDMVDDLWPDPAQLIDLPRAAKEHTKLYGQVRAKRVSGGIKPAWESPVPKRDGLTRTGHQIPLIDRTLYQALVDSFLHSVEPRMASRDHVYGYRAIAPRRSPKPFGKKPFHQWLEFHRKVKAVAATGTYEAVVETDIASFFEQIPHRQMQTELLNLGVSRETAGELRSLLTALMDGDERGIPQGNDASSVIASMYLAQVDRAMLRGGVEYYRYMDDIRMFARSEREARRLLRDLESEVRKLGLNLQPGKTRILVGARDITTHILDADEEIDAIDYHWRSRPKRLALPRVERTWRSESRKTAWNKRLIKFLINRLRMAKDDLAVNWCLKRLGVIDWLAELVAPYLALFADQKRVQVAVEGHLLSDANQSAWEAVALLRMCLSARRLRRDIVDYAVAGVADRNDNVMVRAWSAVLVGKYGDAADRASLVPYRLDDPILARGIVVAVQADPAIRGTTYADVLRAFPELRALVDRYKGLAKERWPLYAIW